MHFSSVHDYTTPAITGELMILEIVNLPQDPVQKNKIYVY